VPVLSLLAGPKASRMIVSIFDLLLRTYGNALPLDAKCLACERRTAWTYARVGNSLAPRLPNQFRNQ